MTYRMVWRSCPVQRAISLRDTPFRYKSLITNRSSISGVSSYLLFSPVDYSIPPKTASAAKGGEFYLGSLGITHAIDTRCRFTPFTSI